MIDTGIYGGSFNPIHVGHVALADAICRQQLVDELWFMVSPQNPLKQNNTDLLDDAKRLELARLAVAGHTKLRVSDFEFGLPRPSYTIDTLRKLHEAYPDRRFTLVLGADNWAIFPRWKEADTLLANYRFVIYPREGFPIDKTTLPANVRVADTPIIPVSSTQVRALIRAGKDASAWLAPAVWRRICEEHLYE